jgi:hypothetical protein
MCDMARNRIARFSLVEATERGVPHDAANWHIVSNHCSAR